VVRGDDTLSLKERTVPYVDLNTLHNPASGTRPPFSWGDAIRDNFELTTYGEWDAYTPTLSQGASTNIAKTLSYSRYARIDRTVIWACRMQATASGSGGSAIEVSLPVNPDWQDANILGVGTAYINDASAGQFMAGVVIVGPGAASANVIRFIKTDTTAITNYVGIDPAQTIASGDMFGFTVMYEAAASL
jgi:hypothetical protein